jgi:hypothetical protein
MGLGCQGGARRAYVVTDVELGVSSAGKQRTPAGTRLKDTGLAVD